MKRLLVGVAALGLLVGAAHAQEKATIAVSIPAADHGWTGGVVFHATEEAKALEKQYPGLKVIVKTSPDGASQANALEDLTTQGINALSDGDIIRLDAINHTIEVKLSDEELAERKKSWKPRSTNYGSGAIWKYAQQVGSARYGAVTQPGGAGEVECYADS